MKHIFLNKKSESTFLALHGTGGDENDLVPLVNYLNPTFNILSPRGNVNEQGMNRFFKRHGIGNYDIKNLEDETTNLNEFISLSITNYGLDQSQMVGLGFSNGANILESLLQLYGPILKKVVLLSPVFLQPNKPFKDLTGVDIFIATSDNDPYVKNKENDRLVDALKAAHANVYVNKHQGGHQINQEILEDLKKWLTK
ncbi:alpha/beta hydrolase [Acholeplasma laidlawii]|uniref:alpha/beta hydrolase n=1 Tax=Acholeplasma laidlawii TaxID=2148 RepID=UPI0018C22230|nr:alpha/beta hydrolase [Acholeplasma laidlawii]MBG0762356.1 alpha/beta hydrolase [Acholeplasma laidlawii]